jgi:hypothetical protein
VLLLLLEKMFLATACTNSMHKADPVGVAQLYPAAQTLLAVRTAVVLHLVNVHAPLADTHSLTITTTLGALNAAPVHILRPHHAGDLRTPGCLCWALSMWALMLALACTACCALLSATSHSVTWSSCLQQ